MGCGSPLKFNEISRQIIPLAIFYYHLYYTNHSDSDGIQVIITVLNVRRHIEFFLFES